MEQDEEGVAMEEEQDAEEEQELQLGGIAISATPMSTGDNVHMNIRHNAQGEAGPCIIEVGAIDSQLLEDKHVRNGNINSHVKGVWSVTATTTFVNGTPVSCGCVSA
eukprot:scpid101551/ scgid2401/ 